MLERRVGDIEEFIQYINVNHLHHSHLQDASKCFECLDYIEKNIDSIIAMVGKKDLLRHPTNGLAFHLAYSNADAAKHSLVNLISEVRGCFDGLMKIEDVKIRKAVIDIFLSNINDSDLGCMEVRLRSALMFYALYESSGGVLDINTLFLQFVTQYPNVLSKQMRVEDVLDFFGDKINHQLPILNEEKEVVPLTWDRVKDYMQSNFNWEELEEDWTQFGIKIPNEIPTTSRRGGRKNWTALYFTTEQQANRYLSYIKAVLPAHRSDLAKITIKYDTYKQLYFELTTAQYNHLKNTLEQTDNRLRKEKEKEAGKGKEKEEISEKIAEPEIVSLWNEIAKYGFLQGDLLYFRNLSEAEKYHAAIANELKINTFNSVRVIKVDEEVRYGFDIDKEQRQKLDYHYQQAFLNYRPPVLAERSLMKSIRSDNKNFIYQFAQTVTRSDKAHKKFPLRGGERRRYTVTAEGVKDRSKKEKKPKNTYLSQQQSFSLVTEKLTPSVFGFAKDRRKKLVGVGVPRDGAELRRKFRRDAGTYHRPFDHDNYETALRYYNAHVKSGTPGLIADEEYFIAAIETDNKGYNEVLARVAIHPDGKSQVFIGSHTLEARLLAQEYARILTQRMRDRALEQNEPWDESYTMPIYFYIPNTDMLHLPYSPLQQMLDKEKALNVHLSNEKQHKKFLNKNYEYLLGLDNQALVEALKKPLPNGKMLLIKIIEDDQLHILEFLLEHLTEGQRNYFLKKVNEAYKKAPEDVFVKLLGKLNLTFNYAALRDLLAQTLNDNRPKLFNHMFQLENYDINFVNSRLYNNHYDTLLTLAIKKEHDEVVKMLVEKYPSTLKTFYPVSEFFNQNFTPLLLASKLDSVDMVACLLDKNADPNLGDQEGNTPLYYAALNGNIEIVNMLLKRGVKPYDTLKKGQQDTVPLDAAINNDHTAVAKLLIKNSRGVSRQLMGHALGCAVERNNREVVQAILESCTDKKKSINEVNVEGYSPLYIAIQGGNLEMARFLLEQGAIMGPSETFFDKIDQLDKQDQPPLMKIYSAITQSDLSPLSLAIEEGHFDFLVHTLESNKISSNFFSSLMPYRNQIMDAFQKQLENSDEAEARLAAVHEKKNKLGEFFATPRYSVGFWFTQRKDAQGNKITGSQEKLFNMKLPKKN